MKPEYIMLIGVVLYAALYGLGVLLFPKTSWQKDDPCERS